MRRFRYVRINVDGKQFAQLDIFAEHNVFNVFEYDINVFMGDWGKMKEFTEAWKERQIAMLAIINTSGKVEVEQNI